MSEIRYDSDGFLLSKNKGQEIERILENTETLLMRTVQKVRKPKSKSPSVQVNNKVVISRKAAKSSNSNVQTRKKKDVKPIVKPKTGNKSKTFNKPVDKRIAPSEIGKAVAKEVGKKEAETIKKANREQAANRSRPTAMQRRAEKGRVESIKQAKQQTDLLGEIAKNGKSKGSLLSNIGAMAGIAKGIFQLPKNLLAGGKAGARRGLDGRFLPAGAKGGLFGKLSKFGKLGKGIAGGGLIAALFGLSNGFGIESDNSLSRSQKNFAHFKNIAVSGGGLAGAAAGAAVGSAILPVFGTIIGGALGGFGGAALMDTWTTQLDKAIDPRLSDQMFGSWKGFLKGTQETFSRLADKASQQWESAKESISAAMPESVKDGAERVTDGVKETASKVSDFVVGKETHVKGGRKSTQEDRNRLLGEIKNAGLLKSNEAIRGGMTEAGTFAAGLDFRKSMGADLNKFSAFNDQYHRDKSPNSMHTRGLALDITNKSGSKNAAREQSRKIYEQLTEMGFKGTYITAKNGKKIKISRGNDFLVQDEYNMPSRNSNGGHIHFNWKDRSTAERYFAMTRGGAVVTTDNRYQRGVNAVKNGASRVINSISGGLKSFISSKESGHNYDIGNVKSGARYKLYRGGKLSKMTLGEVMAEQRAGRLFAAGKYQAIPTTIRQAQRDLKLDPNAKFDSKMQERIGTYLLIKKRPEIAHYLRTGKGFDKAALAGAKEFSSLPLLKGTVNHKGQYRARGESFYKGDKAHHSPEALEAAFRNGHEIYVKGRRLGMTDDEALEYALSNSSVSNTAKTSTGTVVNKKPMVMKSAGNANTVTPFKISAAMSNKALVTPYHPAAVTPIQSKSMMPPMVNASKPSASIVHKPVSRTVNNSHIAHVASGGIMSRQ